MRARSETKSRDFIPRDLGYTYTDTHQNPKHPLLFFTFFRFNNTINNKHPKLLCARIGTLESRAVSETESKRTYKKQQCNLETKNQTTNRQTKNNPKSTFVFMVFTPIK